MNGEAAIPEPIAEADLQEERQASRKGALNVSTSANEPGGSQGCACGSASLSEEGRAGKCAERDCESASLSMLTQKSLCMQHFLFWCYGQLDAVEVILRDRGSDDARNAEVLGMLKGCTDEALLVSLRQPDLGNMERARLLNILLHSWDLKCKAQGVREQVPQRIKRVSTRG